MASWWQEPNVPRDGFTVFAAQQLNAVIPVDETATEREARIVVQRQHMLSTLIGMQQGKSNHGLRHANVVSN